MKLDFARSLAPVYLVLAAVLVGVAGCTGTPECLEQQAYTSAESYPKLTIPPGLKEVASDDALVIPSVSDGPIARYDEEPANSSPENNAARCLTSPPPLPKSTVDMSKPPSES